MRAIGYLVLVLFIGALAAAGAQFVGNAIAETFEEQAAKIGGER